MALNKKTFLNRIVFQNWFSRMFRCTVNFYCLWCTFFTTFIRNQAWSRTALSASAGIMGNILYTSLNHEQLRYYWFSNEQNSFRTFLIAWPGDDGTINVSASIGDSTSKWTNELGKRKCRSVRSVAVRCCPFSTSVDLWILKRQRKAPREQLAMTFSVI